MLVSVGSALSSLQLLALIHIHLSVVDLQAVLSPLSQPPHAEICQSLKYCILLHCRQCGSKSVHDRVDRAPVSVSALWLLTSPDSGSRNRSHFGQHYPVSGSRNARISANITPSQEPDTHRRSEPEPVRVWQHSGDHPVANVK